MVLAMAATTCIPRIHSFKPQQFTNSQPWPDSMKPKKTATLSISRLKLSQSALVSSKRASLVLVACKAEPSGSNAASFEGATLDTKLPRRSLLVKFTCNECGERTQRLINRQAYEKGLVYVQCAGCERYHKLVDNLGLVVEYDFREEASIDSNLDPILSDS